MASANKKRGRPRVTIAEKFAGELCAVNFKP